MHGWPGLSTYFATDFLCTYKGSHLDSPFLSMAALKIHIQSSLVICVSSDMDRDRRLQKSHPKPSRQSRDEHWHYTQLQWLTPTILFHLVFLTTFEKEVEILLVMEFTQ